MNNDVKISVVIITYNQAHCITKALDSITCQKEWVHEIIVSDDCSKDNTWQIVNEYALHYPDLVKPYRNEHNLGIYGNMLAGYKRATGNVIASLAGDDEYMSDCFEKARKYLEEQNVVDKVFALYFDRKRTFADRRPNYTFRNNLVISERRMSYALRHQICEASFFSPQILERCVPPTDLGICGDVYWLLSILFYADVVLYCNAISVIYNAGIGVSVTESSRKFHESDRLVYTRILEKKEFRFSKKDIKYAQYELHRNNAYCNPSFVYLLSTTWRFMKSIDFSLGIRHIGVFNHIKFIARYLVILIFKSK